MLMLSCASGGKSGAKEIPGEHAYMNGGLYERKKRFFWQADKWSY